MAMTTFSTFCANSPYKWKIGDKEVSSSTFELRAGQFAIYTGSINNGNFKNFSFKTHINHTDGAKASFWFHSDATFSKGYSVFIGKPTDDRRRSGSLASVRNLYKPATPSFDLEVKVEGKRIIIMIDGFKVVDYLEPESPFRTASNSGQLLSSGLIGFQVENGTLNIKNTEITPLADNLPNYLAEMKPIDEQNDVLIRLQQRNFPVIDYHVHWPQVYGLETAIGRSLADGFEFGIAANCGIGFQITSDEQIKARFENDFILPPLFYAMQGEGREWPEIFSRESRDRFDYVFTDALTFQDHAGRRTQLWIDRTVIIDIPEQEYMDMIMDRTLKIIKEEPIDFLASPTRLSAAMMKDYDKYWTDDRITKFIKALKDNNVALEINAVTKVPSKKIILAAKAAGIKFTLGTNNNGIQELDRLDYSLRMVDECNLTIDDMWFPEEKRDSWNNLKTAFEKQKAKQPIKEELEKADAQNKQSDIERDGVIIVDVTKNYSPKIEMILQDFMDVEYIVLETKDGFQNQGFVQDIGKEFIVVRNGNDDGNIFVYDRNGKALRKINCKEQAGEEFRRIYNVVLDEEKGEIFVNDLKKIYVFDLNGKLKRSFKHKEGGGSIFYTDIFNYDKDNLICYDAYNQEIAFLLISKKDGNITQEIKIPFKAKKVLQQQSNEGTVSPGPYRTIIPYKGNWMLLEHSSDTVYTFLPDYSLSPFLVRTPSIQSMEPGIFLMLRLLSDRYIFMETIKNEYDWNARQGFPKTFFMYDKQQKALLGYTVYNGDYSSKSEIYMSFLRPANHEIDSWQTLFPRRLVDEYKMGILKGQLKEIAAELDNESNPIIMLVKHKK